jgi:hypothetical protein
MKQVDSGKKDSQVEVRNEARRNRIRFAGPRKRLQIDESLLDPEYEYHWFNDDNGEVAQAERAEYVFVTKDEIKDPEAIGDKEVHGGNTDLNSFVSRVVGRNRAGGEMRAFLMKLRKEVYDADQEWREQEVNAQVDAALLAGKPSGSSVENAYGLKASISRGLK